MNPEAPSPITSLRSGIDACVKLAEVYSAGLIFRRDGDGPWRLLEGGLAKPLDAMPYALLTHPQVPDYLLTASPTDKCGRDTTGERAGNS